MKNIQVLLLALVVTSTTQTHVNEENDALNNIQDGLGHRVDIGGIEYYVSDADEQVSSVTAFQRCNEMGMRLISMDSVKKQSQLEAYFSANAGEPYWTSGVYYASNLWLWRGSGLQFTSTSPGWLVGEPGYFFPVDSCVLMQAGGREAVYCTELHPYVCEPLCSGAV